MAINWSILQPVDVGARFNEGWDRGTAMREKAELKSALAAYGQDPTNPDAQSALAAASPQFAAKMAEQRWKEQADIRERQRLASFFGGDQSGMPAGLNGKPDYRSMQRRALMAGEPTVAVSLGGLADDEERVRREARDLLDKRSKVTSSFNPITGAETYYDWQGNPIGDDEHPFVRDADGVVHPHGWTPPAATAPVAAPDAGPPTEPYYPADPLAPAPAAAAQTPAGSPLDPNLGKAQAPAQQFTQAAQPGETMEAYLRRRAAEGKQMNPDRAAEIDQMLNAMLADIGVTP
jgi:hypothetical protein